jgi:hypothetical protein
MSMGNQSIIGGPFNSWIPSAIARNSFYVAEPKSSQFPSPPKTASNCNRATDFHHLVVGQFKDISYANRVARHRGKYCFLPTRDTSAIIAWYDGLMADVKSDVVTVNFDTLGSTVIEYGQHIWAIHESVACFDAPEFVGNTLNLNPFAPLCTWRWCDNQLEYEDVFMQGAIFSHMPH